MVVRFSVTKCFRNVNSFALIRLGISLESVCAVDAKAINALNQLFLRACSCPPQIGSVSVYVLAPLHVVPHCVFILTSSWNSDLRKLTWPLQQVKCS